MSTLKDPRVSVEAFARLCEALDRPFADKAHVLRAAGLNAEGFVQLQEQWALRMTAGAEDLGARFAAAYAFARAGQSAADGDATPAVLPPTVELSSPGIVSPARMPLETAEVDVSSLLRPTVPFHPSGPPATAVAVPAVRSPAPAQSPGSTGTVEIDLSAMLRRRLVRFDPQTGAPLAAPYWEEIPDPGPQKT
jgi:hypothetical protein